MRNEFTVIVRKGKDRFIGCCPQVPGACGFGRTIEECRRSVNDSIRATLAMWIEEDLSAVRA